MRQSELLEQSTEPFSPTTEESAYPSITTNQNSVTPSVVIRNDYFLIFAS